MSLEKNGTMETPPPSAVKSMMYNTDKRGPFKFWTSIHRTTVTEWTDGKRIYIDSDITRLSSEVFGWMVFSSENFGQKDPYFGI